MEEKKTIKISLKMAISIFFIFSIIVLLLFVIINNNTLDLIPEPISKTVSIKTYQNKDYYIIEGDYSGEYDLQYTYLSKYFGSNFDIEEKFEKQIVMDYAEYKAYCETWGFKQKYTSSSQNYIVFSYCAKGTPHLDAKLAAVEYTNNNVNLYIWDDTSGVTDDISAYVIVIPTTNTVNNINIQPVYTKTEYENIKKYDVPYNPREISIDKPIIYLYPEKEMEVSVKVGLPENLTCSYPKYINGGWKVQAKSNGDLIDLFTKKNLYSLYYESKGIIDFKIENTGFIVKGSDTIQFLEEKLELLGLTERESEEFIIYWLPKLQINEYNYIRFASEDEINTNMPLEISPNPDTIIRVSMTFKRLENPIEVQEQTLITPERKGFVAVEWGGTEIKF